MADGSSVLSFDVHFQIMRRHNAGNNDESFTKTFLDTNIETRQQQKSEIKEKGGRKRKEQKLLLELLKLNLAAGGSNSQDVALTPNVAMEMNIQNLIPKFMENSDITAYLKLFESQYEKVNIKSKDYVTHFLPFLALEFHKLFYENQRIY